MLYSLQYIILITLVFLSSCDSTPEYRAFNSSYPPLSFSKVQFKKIKPAFASERLSMGNTGQEKLNLNHFKNGQFLNENQIDSLLSIINDSTSFSPADLITCAKEAVLLFYDKNNVVVARIELGCSYSLFVFSPPIGPRNALPLTEKADARFEAIVQSLNLNH